MLQRAGITRRHRQRLRWMRACQKESKLTPWEIGMSEGASEKTAPKYQLEKDRSNEVGSGKRGLHQAVKSKKTGENKKTKVQCGSWKKPKTKE